MRQGSHGGRWGQQGLLSCRFLSPFQDFGSVRVPVRGPGRGPGRSPGTGSLQAPSPAVRGRDTRSYFSADSQPHPGDSQGPGQPRSCSFTNTPQHCHLLQGDTWRQVRGVGWDKKGVGSCWGRQGRPPLLTGDSPAGAAGRVGVEAHRLLGGMCWGPADHVVNHQGPQEA